MPLFQFQAPAKSTVKTVQWSDAAQTFVYSKKVGNDWVDVPVSESFLLDIWQTKYGWEKFKPNYECVTAPLFQKLAMPTTDDKWTEFYAVPVYSTELGGRRDLMIRNANSCKALEALYSSLLPKLKEIEESGDLEVPIVQVTTGLGDDLGPAPVFTVEDEWAMRMPTCGQAIVSFR